MATIHYPFQIDYSYDEDGNLLPRLAFALSLPRNPGKRVDIDAYLDSGSERSLIDGWVGRSLGLDVLSGPRLGYETTMGTVLTATLYTVRLSHDDLGDFELEVGFTSVNIKRNLLGRDFFNLLQIGFRERRQMFYVSLEP